MAKERRLGRGLEALLNKVSDASTAADNIAVTKQDSGKQSFTQTTESVPADSTVSNIQSNMSEQKDTIHYLDINQIDTNPYQPRLDFDPDEINELAKSLSEHGLLQATVVRRKDGGRYELVYGERRLRAALQVGWQQIPALIIEASDNDMAELSLVENLQRKDLNAMEKAISFQRYLAIQKCTQEVLAKRLCLDRSTIANLIRLLDLPDDIQAAIREDKISAAHARALLPLGEPDLQRDFVKRIVEESLSAHQVEQMVRDFINQEHDSPDVLPIGKKPKSSAQISELERLMIANMGMKVKLTQSSGGRGKITINFKNHEQFERLHAILMSGDYSDVIEKKTRRAA